MIKRSMGLFLLMSALCAPLAYADEPSGTASGASEAATASSAVAAEASAAAPAAAAAAVLSAPALVSADKLSAGDTAWMLTSTALVLMMCVPGLALFYGGMVRKKNVLATLMQSFACTCVVTILWWLIGYSWAFTPGSTPFLGGATRVLFHGMSYIH